MITYRFPLGILLCVLLVSCDNSTSSSASKPPSSDSDKSLVGTWLLDEGSEKTVRTFTATRIHDADYLNKCLIQETWGSYVLSEAVLRVNIDSVYMRSYFTMDQDSASTCANPMERQGVTGSMSIPLENITVTSFTAVTMSFSIVDGKSTTTQIRSTFVKQ